MQSTNDVEQSGNDQHSTNDGGRHVHFGGVNVIREYDNDDNQDNNSSRDEQDGREGSESEHGGSPEREKRESEIPLTSSAGLS